MRSPGASPLVGPNFRSRGRAIVGRSWRRSDNRVGCSGPAAEVDVPGGETSQALWSEGCRPSTSLQDAQSMSLRERVRSRVRAEAIAG
jgi:hypothetical protein